MIDNYNIRLSLIYIFSSDNLYEDWGQIAIESCPEYSREQTGYSGVCDDNQYQSHASKKEGGQGKAGDKNKPFVWLIKYIDYLFHRLHL
jgi:hypothetical protein